MYDVWVQRTNIYLDDRQLALLRRLGAQRGEPVAGLVRQAVDEWLERRGVRELDPDEWQARFDALLQRRMSTTESGGADQGLAEADVAAAVTAVRAERGRARGR
jgi:hypothetical protein